MKLPSWMSHQILCSTHVTFTIWADIARTSAYYFYFKDSDARWSEHSFNNHLSVYQITMSKEHSCWLENLTNGYNIFSFYLTKLNEPIEIVENFDKNILIFILTSITFLCGCMVLHSSKKLNLNTKQVILTFHVG